jgi:hypothetical protein
VRRAFAAAALLAACAAPLPKAPPKLDLRVCVQEESLVEAWAEHFSKAAAVEPREGRECDVVARAASILNAGKVTLRSAYDGSVVTEIEGPLELVPRLAAMSLAADSDHYARLKAAREKAGFTR